MKSRLFLFVGLFLAGCQSSGHDTPPPVPAPAAAQMPVGGEPVHSLAAEEVLPHLSPVTLTASQSDVVKMGVANQTKNMETATFGPMSAGVDTGGIITVCGLVDSDNGKGGKTGMQPYVGVLDGPAKNPTDFRVANMGDGADLSTAIRNVCSRQGTPING
jgi:hypothetical protein